MATAPSNSDPAAMTPPDLQLVPCQHCNRKFTAEALSRHQPICMKGAMKRRRPFDSFRQRAEGTEIISYRPTKSVPTSASVTPSRRRSNVLTASTSTSSNWRQKHNELIEALRNARLTRRAMDAGKPLPPPPPPSVNPDYIQCPYCSRRFNQKAAERHIPFCKEKNEQVAPMKTALKPTTSRPSTMTGPSMIKPTATNPVSTKTTQGMATDKSGGRVGAGAARTSPATVRPDSGRKDSGRTPTVASASQVKAPRPGQSQVPRNNNSSNVSFRR